MTMSKRVETILKELVEKANKDRQATTERREKFKRRQQGNSGVKTVRDTRTKNNQR